MKYCVKTTPNARKNAVKEENGVLKVHVAAPAVDGKANEALKKILADYFHVRANRVLIVKGETSRDKWVEVVS